MPGSPRRRIRRRYRATVRSETAKPSFSNSPWILGAPQPAFSSAIRWISTRISSVILGRPPRVRERHRQYNRKPALCQPTTVSGFTMTRTSVQRDQTLRRVVQKNLSRSLNTGRGRFLLRTASCCRSARTSSATSPRSRKNIPTAQRKEAMRAIMKPKV